MWTYPDTDTDTDTDIETDVNTDIDIQTHSNTHTHIHKHKTQRNTDLEAYKYIYKSIIIELNAHENIAHEKGIIKALAVKGFAFNCIIDHDSFDLFYYHN